jgi:hypothetical protein
LPTPLAQHARAAIRPTPPIARAARALHELVQRALAVRRKQQREHALLRLRQDRIYGAGGGHHDRNYTPILGCN